MVLIKWLLIKPAQYWGEILDNSSNTLSDEPCSEDVCTDFLLRSYHSLATGFRTGPLPVVLVWSHFALHLLCFLVLTITQSALRYTHMRTHTAFSISSTLWITQISNLHITIYWASAGKRPPWHLVLCLDTFGNVLTRLSKPAGSRGVPPHYNSPPL